jgi:hypothetical protein
MPATPTIIGALLGLGTQMYSNALRKLPYMRRIAFFPTPSSLSAIPFLDFLICFHDASYHPPPAWIFISSDLYWFGGRPQNIWAVWASLLLLGYGFLIWFSH